MATLTGERQVPHRDKQRESNRFRFSLSDCRLMMIGNTSYHLLLSTTAKVTKSAPVPKSVVTHNGADVAALVDRAVDVLWPSCYNTGSWDSLRPESLGIGSDSATVETSSQAAYQRLVFDLTAHAVTTVCDETTTVAGGDTSQPWRHRRLIASRPVPQSASEAKPPITATVLKYLGLESTRPDQLLSRYSGQVRGRRCTDHVDNVLTAELVEEESLWTDYANDELSTKMQVANMLFDMMISETVETLTGAVARKHHQYH